MTEKEILKNINSRCIEACCPHPNFSCFLDPPYGTPSMAMRSFMQLDVGPDRFTRVTSVAVNEYKKYYGTK